MKPNRQESEGNLASHTKLRSAAVQLVEAIELLGADDEDARATHAVNAIAGHVAAIANSVEILTFEAGTDDTDWLVDRVGEAITAGLALAAASVSRLQAADPEHGTGMRPHMRAVPGAKP